LLTLPIQVAHHSLELAPGEPFRKRVADDLKGKDFAVQRPGAEASRTAGQVTADERQSFLRYAGTEKAGAYRVEHRGEPVAIFAVQMIPRKAPARGEVGSVGGNSQRARGENRRRSLRAMS